MHTCLVSSIPARIQIQHVPAGYFPEKATGDGNCFYNSVSLLLTRMKSWLFGCHFVVSNRHTHAVPMYVAAFEAIPNDGSDPGQDNCHMAVYGAHVHPSDGVWVECSVWQRWSHWQCVRCHNTLLKGQNSLAATLKLYELIKHHTFHSYVCAYSQVHARLGIRTAIADYVHRVLNWPSREVK